MPVIKSIKDVVVGQAMRLAAAPACAKFASDPRLMNVAMKGPQPGRHAQVRNGPSWRTWLAGVLGLATQQEVANLRATIQQLEDTVSTLEAKTAAARTQPAPRCFYCGQFGARPSRATPKHMWVCQSR